VLWENDTVLWENDTVLWENDAALLDNDAVLWNNLATLRRFRICGIRAIRGCSPQPNCGRGAESDGEFSGPIATAD
jgi:hypothetical protein